VYKQILINAKLKTGKRGQKTELTGSPLRRSRSEWTVLPSVELEEEMMMICLVISM